MESILLLRPDKAGDAVKTLPILRAIRNQHPHLDCHIVVSTHNASLVAFESGWTSHLFDSESLKVKAFDAAINLLSDPSPESIQILNHVQAEIKGSIHYHGFSGKKLNHLPGGPGGIDETLNIGNLVSQVIGLDLDGLNEISTAPTLSPLDDKEAIQNMGETPKNSVGICPIAGLSHRSHSVTRWKELLRFIERSRTFENLYLFGSTNDRAALLDLAGETTFRVIAPSSFRALAAHFMKLSAVVAIDSGPLHLARALAIPSLGILSGGDAQRWFGLNVAHSLILKRGVFNRHPSLFEIKRVYDKWVSMLRRAKCGSEVLC